MDWMAHFENIDELDGPASNLKEWIDWQTSLKQSMGWKFNLFLSYELAAQLETTMGWIDEI